MVFRNALRSTAEFRRASLGPGLRDPAPRPGQPDHAPVDQPGPVMAESFRRIRPAG
jgi:hypothetical protein